MRLLLEVARLQLLSNIRNQVHLVTLFMLTGLMMLPAYVNAYALGPELFRQVTEDLGLTLLGYFGVAMALMLGTSIVPDDIERKTIYPILARPLGRFTYLTGQFLGVALLLGVSLLFLAAAFAFGIYSLLWVYDGRVLLAAYGNALECSVLLAAALCASLFTSPTVAGLSVLALYLLGGMSGTALEYFVRSHHASPALAGGLAFLKGLLPGFDLFRLKYAVAHRIAVSPLYLLGITAYAMGWSGLFLVVAAWKFGKKDL